MQSYFLVYTRRSDGYCHVSPLAFPLEEAERRFRKTKISVKKEWKITYEEAPPEHQKWSPEIDNCLIFPLADFKQIINVGQRQLVANHYYGLLSGAPNEEEFLQ